MEMLFQLFLLHIEMHFAFVYLSYVESNGSIWEVAKPMCPRLVETPKQMGF